MNCYSNRVSRGLCWVWWGGLLSAALVGCGSNELMPVSGTVTLDGKPLSGATVRFVPHAEGGTTFTSFTDENGRYEIMSTVDKAGIEAGTYTVQVEAPKPGGDKFATKFESKTQPTKQIESGASDVNIELTSEDFGGFVAPKLDPITGQPVGS